MDSHFATGAGILSSNRKHIIGLAMRAAQLARHNRYISVAPFLFVRGGWGCSAESKRRLQAEDFGTHARRIPGRRAQKTAIKIK